MILALQVLALVATMLLTVFMMGALNPYHPYDSYLLVGLPITAIVGIIAFVFARRFTGETMIGDFERTLGKRLMIALVLLAIVVMPPTVAILLANQLLDDSPGVNEILPVTQTYADVSKGGHTYYVVVPARMPPRRLFRSPEAQERFHLPYSIWHLLVAGHSTLTLRVHDGRFGFPWFSVMTFTP